ncbi:hypothetical protein Q9K01_13285 [Qipengyuania sp. DY56-A-20]|uniref:Uncharacterized protein n=1 Tax=Qipengyuania benthica TaxID=3067651 RepID=A0ABT9HBB8_9SPHN|nr:hypothetical protein [Qipengyuania sp. DY56-A-20]MDP4540600.1 hypothetical protein [Qipengyuania sp. DY56-A-20]
MFEGHIKPSQAVAPGEQRESQHLHQLRWTDLVARLAATRDLREEMGHTGEAGFAGFSVSLPELGEKGKCDGNQDILRHGKFTGSKPAAAANDAAQGDRDDT